MSRSDRMRNEPVALKPIGFALAAVVAGLGSAKADTGSVHKAASTPAPDQPTASAGVLASFAPDDVLLLDTPLDSGDVPLAEKPTPASPQADLFETDVPLARG